MSATDPALRDDLQRLLDDFVARGIVGASLAVAGASDAPLLLVSGLADRAAGVPLTPDRLFKIGSCTKTFVGACLMSLAQDGVVSLTAPVATWFPDLPFADRIGVRQLVDHSAGLPEFEYVIPMDPGPRLDAGGDRGARLRGGRAPRRARCDLHVQQHRLRARRHADRAADRHDACGPDPRAGA